MPHRRLLEVGLKVFPCWARFNPERQRWDKGPAVPGGESWKTVDPTDPRLDWSSGVIGIMIPPGVMVLDLDSYKGSTRQSVESYLGIRLAWDAALIQRTLGGGEHYAFQTGSVELKQITEKNLGFDTRTAGRGFICTGRGYTPVGPGAIRLAWSSSLPPLPDAVIQKLKAPQSRKISPQPTNSSPSLIEALRHLDPGCDRVAWIRIGCALRDAYREDPDTGLEVFDQWSSGALWAGGTPENYVAETTPRQWWSLKPDGQITVATLYYQAIASGWKPPNSFDASAAFGSNAAAAETFNTLVERIRRDGCDIKQTESLVQEITNGGFNGLQIGLLTAELKTELGNRSAVNKAIDQISESPQTNGGYGKSDIDNAELFLNKYYPGQKLIRSQGELYHYDSRIWGVLDPDVLRHQVATDMGKQRMQLPRINACIDLVNKLVPVANVPFNQSNPHLIVFQNGMLDTLTGTLYAHYQPHLSTILLPYDYTPNAPCRQWLQFLNQVFDRDQQRVSLLQEWIGYLLTADYSHHKVMMLLGPLRCGKGTIGRIIRQVIGSDNFFGGSISSFTRDSFLHALATRSVLFIGDAEKKFASARIAQIIERIKSISGNDAVDFDRKWLPAISTALPTRITIAANGVPALFDDSGALASRMLVLPFYQSFYGREDLTLADRLSTELSGIASWALEGLYRLRQNGRFTEPEAGKEEIQYIQESYSPLKRFLLECCIFGPEVRITANQLYEVYRVWCLAENEDLIRRRPFVSAIRDATRANSVTYGTLRFDGKSCRGFQGLHATAPPIETFTPNLRAVT